MKQIKDIKQLIFEKQSKITYFLSEYLLVKKQKTYWFFNKLYQRNKK